MVPRAGFEPAIFAVRGRRPEPLDQHGITFLFKGNLAAEEGFEPSRTDPESAVLPLDDSALKFRFAARRLKAEVFY